MIHSPLWMRIGRGWRAQRSGIPFSRYQVTHVIVIFTDNVRVARRALRAYGFYRLRRVKIHNLGFTP
jgi:hypothetical protein